MADAEDEEEEEEYEDEGDAEDDEDDDEEDSQAEDDEALARRLQREWEEEDNRPRGTGGRGGTTRRSRRRRRGNDARRPKKSGLVVERRRRKATSKSVRQLKTSPTSTLSRRLAPSRRETRYGTKKGNEGATAADGAKEGIERLLCPGNLDEERVAAHPREDAHEARVPRVGDGRPGRGAGAARRRRFTYYTRFWLNKWKQFSFLHVSWETKRHLESIDQKACQRAILSLQGRERKGQVPGDRQAALRQTGLRPADGRGGLWPASFVTERRRATTRHERVTSRRVDRCVASMAWRRRVDGVDPRVD